jgi:hypothetical protein
VGQLTPPTTTPTLASATRAPIVEGTPLGEAQLNATASVAGTFVCTPVAGTLLSAGTHTLTATFTPTDTTHYTTATASVNLTVTAMVNPGAGGSFLGPLGGGGWSGGW